MRHIRTSPLAFALAGIAALTTAGTLVLSAQTTRFFPVAVWYGGGKARAPMLERDARSKKEIWRTDVQQIKKLGFNTLRAWVDWASGEPAERAYHFETLDVLLDVPAGDYAGTDIVQARAVALVRESGAVRLDVTLAGGDVQVVRLARRAGK